MELNISEVLSFLKLTNHFQNQLNLYLPSQVHKLLHAYTTPPQLVESIQNHHFCVTRLVPQKPIKAAENEAFHIEHTIAEMHTNAQVMRNAH